MRANRIIIAVVVFILGSFVYLASSGAPGWVRALSVPLEAILLLTPIAVLSLPLPRGARLAAAAAAALLASGLHFVLLDRHIGPSGYNSAAEVLLAVILLTLEATAFACVVLFVEFLVAKLQREKAAPN